MLALAGLVALPQLPIGEYPEVVPPTVIVKTTYAGADPSVIAETVASPLEQAINGVEGMLYQSSQSTADGVMTLTITFALGTDGDKAQVLVQNRVAQVLARLPHRPTQFIQLFPLTQRDHASLWKPKDGPTLRLASSQVRTGDVMDVGYRPAGRRTARDQGGQR